LELGSFILRKNKTIKGYKNSFVKRDWDSIIQGDYYLKIGKMNYVAHKSWYDLAKIVNNVKKSLTVTKDEIVSVGALTGTIAHPREVFKSAIKESAHSVILVHNHPSGDVTPSQEDIMTTIEIKNASKKLGFVLVDHLIMTHTQYFSMRQQKII
jgi:DNA repair protein RadC